MPQVKSFMVFMCPDPMRPLDSAGEVFYASFVYAVVVLPVAADYRYKWLGNLAKLFIRQWLAGRWCCVKRHIARLKNFMRSKGMQIAGACCHPRHRFRFLLGQCFADCGNGF